MGSPKAELRAFAHIIIEAVRYEILEAYIYMAYNKKTYVIHILVSMLCYQGLIPFYYCTCMDFISSVLMSLLHSTFCMINLRNSRILEVMSVCNSTELLILLTCVGTAEKSKNSKMDFVLFCFENKR